MSRPIFTRNILPVDQTPRDSVATTPGRLVYYNQPRGMFPTKAHGDLGLDECEDILNMRLSVAGKFIPGEPSLNYTVTGKSVVSMYTFLRSDRNYFYVFGTTDGFTIKNASTGGDLITLTGPAISDVIWGDPYSFVPWGNYVITTQGVVGMHKLDMTNYTYTAISAAPVGARHVTVFGNRVIATQPTHQPGRIQWSVKNDCEDWTGLGSGYEDLLASAGGHHDLPWSVWPIDGNRALIVRERSVWLMSTTGFVDAPFRFDRLADVGTPMPNSIAPIPGGIVMVTYDDIVVVRPDGWQSIGAPVAERIFNRNNATEYFPTPLYVYGVYVKSRQEYWFGYYLYNSTVTKIAWRYSFRHNAWSRTDFGIPMHYSETLDSVTYDSVSATYDSSTLPLEIFGSVGVTQWAVFYPLGTATVPSRGETIGTKTSSSFTTGDIVAGDDPDSLVTVTKITIHYEHDQDVNAFGMQVMYSVDQGNSFNNLENASSITPAGSYRSYAYTIDQTVTSHTIRFKVIISSSAHFRLVRMNVYTTRGEELTTVQS